jgi:hypothetical protein
MSSPIVSPDKKIAKVENLQVISHFAPSPSFCASDSAQSVHGAVPVAAEEVL